MNVLIVSHLFAPYNLSGSIRLTKLAEFLHDRGHDVHVLTCGDLAYPRTLGTRFPEERVTRTGWIDLDAGIAKARRFVSGVRGDAGATRAAGAAGGRVATSGGRWIAAAYRALVGVPDIQIGWRSRAVKAGKAIVDARRPDVVISSALPFTAHVVAAEIARRAGAPWVADYRDLFVGNPYQRTFAWRRFLDEQIERSVVRGCACMTTVSEPLALALRKTHGKPTLVVRNGFDPADLPQNVAPLAPRERLLILHTGIIYPGRRDPTPLFRALSDGWRRDEIEVCFIGQDNRGVEAMARACGVTQLVSVGPAVPYAESLRTQAAADVLLLLLGRDADEEGVFTGKLFEYIGAGRPILCLGTPDGVAARAITERGLGVVANEPDAINAALRRWAGEKRENGALMTPPERRLGFDRSSQFALLEQELFKVALSGSCE